MCSSDLLARMKDGEVLRTIVRDFEAAGYHFDVWNMYAPDYGVPQSRKRLIFVGVRNDIDGFPAKPVPGYVNAPVTISEALKDLEAIEDEEEFNHVSNLFMERLGDEYDFEE